MRKWVAAAVGLLVLSTVAACGSEQAGRDPAAAGRPAASVVPTAVGEPSSPGPELPSDTDRGWPGAAEVARAQCHGDVPEHLPAGLGAVEAYVCTTERRPVPGDGTWQFAVVGRATAGADALLVAYAIPDAEPGSGPCTADAPDPRRAWVVEGDAVHAVRAPQDSCGKPTPDAIDAYAELTTEVVAEERLHQLSSELADRVGCEDVTGDLLAYGQMFEPEYPERDLGDLRLGVDRACTYAVDAPPPDDKVAGALVTAQLLDAAERAAIDAALAESVEDPECARIGHTRFVVLRSDATEKQIFVALDGCAVQLDGTWWRATDELRALLSG